MFGWQVLLPVFFYGYLSGLITDMENNMMRTMTEPERKKDGQLFIPFTPITQLAIQFKEKQR